MVNWKEAHSEPGKTSEAELFAKLVNNWKPLIFFKKKGSKYASAAWKVNCEFCLYIAIWKTMYFLPFQHN